jgi:ATP-binding cassette subfamily B protein
LIAEGSILGLGLIFTLVIELGLPFFFYIVMQDYLETGQLNFNSLMFILSYMLMYLAMFDVMQYSLLGQHMLNAVSRVEKMLNQPVMIEPKTPQYPETYDIAFSNVSFGYGKKEVLHNVSFVAKEKGLTALVGHSGAGKSTITNLIPLFWNTYSGSITIGGVDVRDIPNKDLMEIFSFVFQDVYLFNDTIYNNILCGRKDASREEVLKAARKAHCHEFIEKLENGYDTIVSEGGSTLSGGQKQRLSIARAMLKDAPVVILDEATTALDPINELYIQEAISELIQDKTVITIAHRLYTIVNADNIVVLQDGNVLDSGLHSYLADNCSTYRTMLDSTQ